MRCLSLLKIDDSERIVWEEKLKRLGRLKKRKEKIGISGQNCLLKQFKSTAMWLHKMAGRSTSTTSENIHEHGSVCKPIQGNVIPQNRFQSGQSCISSSRSMENNRLNGAIQSVVC